jgi:hypothetical protein
VDDDSQITAALTLLGDVLEERGLAFDLVVIGGGALLLQQLIRRPTLDLDVVARIERDAWLTSKPLPAPLVAAIRDVAEALDLPREPRDDKDWLNGGPSFLRNLGLPAGFEGRASTRRFGPLTIRVAAREDLIALKLWAATDPRRGQRRAVDVHDLQELHPTGAELRAAVRWCRQKDGRPDFVTIDLAPAITALGFSVAEVADG